MIKRTIEKEEIKGRAIEKKGGWMVLGHKTSEQNTREVDSLVHFHLYLGVISSALKSRCRLFVPVIVSLI